MLTKRELRIPEESDNDDILLQIISEASLTQKEQSGSPIGLPDCYSSEPLNCFGLRLLSTIAGRFGLG